MRSLTVSFLSGLLLSMGLFGPAMTPAVADQPAVSQSGPTDNAPLPLYQPPRKLTPRARVGGGLRGTDGSDPCSWLWCRTMSGSPSKRLPF